MEFMPNCQKRQWIALGLLAVLIAVGPARAQSFVASIGGTVRDASGGFVPGVKVTVTDVTTNVSTTVMTNSTGNYMVPFLKSSAYKVTFEKDGFEKSVSENITLVMNQKLRLDSALQVGNVTQSVTVSATATQLNRVSSDIGGEILHTDLVNLPAGGSVLGLAPIFAGISGSSPNYGNPNNYSLGGGRTNTVPIIIDGLTSNMGADNTYGLQPTADSTEELQVLTAPFSAQYGQTGGGAILTTSRAGTVALHGSLFEYHNNQHLNALNYFSSAGTVRAVSINNYFGGSLGGPVYIPKLFNGKKHQVYFFTDWEDTLSSGGKLLNQNVPTPAELTGDFSGLTPQGTSVKIYDPRTTQTVSGKVTRQLFAGNIIPPTLIDSVGAKIASFYPAPNCTLSPFNYCVAPTSGKTNLYNVDRVDVNPNDYDRVWFRFARAGPTTFAVPYIDNAANPSALNGWKDYHAASTWNHIFSASMANEFRFGIVEERNFSSPETSDVSALGLKGVPQTQFPTVSVTSLYGLGASSYSRTRDRHWIWNDALSLQTGRHHFQMGAEFMRYTNHVFTPGVLSGGYSFTGTFTSLPGTAGTGFGLADLLLGYPATTTITSNNYEFRYNTNYAALYIQDDYKLTSRLTLNLGFRWEFDGPPTEANGQNYTFNPNLIDPATGKPGAIQFAGINGAPSHFVPNDYRGFLPRVGFAYSLLKNTVIRGGYGIYQLPSIGFITNGQTSKYSIAASFPSPDGVTPAYQLSQGVPAYSYNVGSDGLPKILSNLTKPAANVQWQQLTPVIPYLQEWQFGIQHQFGRGWFTEINYQGNRGVHLPVTLQTNQIPPSPGCCYGLATAQSLRPYPQWLNVPRFTNDGNANYHGLLLKVQHYWRDGLSMLFTYTWAKTMNDVDAAARADAVANQNVYNLRAQYGIAMIDIPHRATLAWVYELPFGAGGKLARGTPVVRHVIGHWQVSGTASFQIGYPYSVAQTNTLGLFSPIQYANAVGNPTPSVRTIAQWFDPKAFAIAQPNTLGNAPRAAFFGPGQNEWNVSVSRSFPIKERFSFKISSEFSNVFNHPEWNNLNMTITSPAFGAVTSAMNSRVIRFVGRVNF